MKDYRNLLDGKAVWEEEILAARESRVCRQKHLLSLFHCTLICLSLNIPGPVKCFTLSEMTFSEGEKRIKNQLERNGISLIHSEVITDSLGTEGYYLVESEPEPVKRYMIELEDCDEFTRIFDIDVMDATERKLGRTELGFSQRKCYICGEDAFICSSRKRHPCEQVIQHMLTTMDDHFNHKFAEYTSSLAMKALSYEVAVSPKPGLVDRFHNGAHDDMDYFMFLDSIAALIPYFYQTTLYAAQFPGTLEEMLTRSRFMGKEAESDMFAATGGVNTHKGIVFSFGLLCACAGFLFQKNKRPSADAILSACASMGKLISQYDFPASREKKDPSHGEKQFLNYGMSGARGEAASGFSSIRRFGLPSLKKALAMGFSMNDAGVYALLNLIANVNDTNAVFRSNFLVQEALKATLYEKISARKMTAEAVRAISLELDKQCVNENISHGGCADLLAVTFFVYFYDSGHM